MAKIHKERVTDVLKKLYRVERYKEETDEVTIVDEWQPDHDEYYYEVINFIQEPLDLEILFKHYSEISDEVKSKYDYIYLDWACEDGYHDCFDIRGSRLETDEEYNKRLDGIKKSEEKKKKQRESKKKRVLEKKIEQFEKLKKEIAAAQEKG